MPESFTHDQVAIISTGDEMVLGESLNTNSRLLADRLMALGIPTVEHVTLGDDRALTALTLQRLAQRVQLIITTGGLGPTMDDLMRDALADALGEPLITDDRALARLEARFAARGRKLTDNQRLQAKRPASATCIDNENGTAPGLHAVLLATQIPPSLREGAGGRVHSGFDAEPSPPTDHVSSTSGPAADIFCLPGPPRELLPMFESYIIPRLRPPPGRAIRTRFLHTIGLGEGDVANRLGDLLSRGRNPIVGITVAGAVVTLRIRAAAPTVGQADELAALDGKRIRDSMGIHVFGEGNETLPGAIVRKLAETGRALAVVESCTGGLLGEMLTEIPGSSAVFRGGWITYSNQMKTAAVGVSESLLARHGAVSPEVAAAMAVGGLNHAWQGEGGSGHASGAGGRHGLAITGVAGPDGGSPQKPVGTVFVAHAWQAAPQAQAQHEVRHLLITGDRTDIRQRAARSALALLHYHLCGAPPMQTPLLWEIARPKT